jgi:hypothetical protein
MAVDVFTVDAEGLLRSLRRRMREGRIDGWAYDDQFESFTHTPAPWKGQGWFQPEVCADKLRFVLKGTEGTPYTRELFTVYHSRFIEMLLTQGFDRWDSARVAGYPGEGEPEFDDTRPR